MSKDIFYHPCLMLKAAELRAVERLPSVSKDKILPCVLLRPWLTAKDLKKGLERFEVAFPDRRYFIDIDYDYAFGREADLHPDFEVMVRGNFIMRNYFEFISKFPNAIPLLRFRDGFESFANLDKQFVRIDELGRGFGLRLHERIMKSNPIYLIDKILPYLVGRDVTIFMDIGWIANLDKGYAIAHPVLDYLSEAAQRGELSGGRIVVSGSSFPKSFADINGVKFVSNVNYSLFQRAFAEFGNKLNLRYGDWGSARPADRGFAIVIPARIDYPVDGGWHIARNPEKWNYQQAAAQIVSNSAWLDDLELWGANLISATAKQTSGVDKIEHPKDNVQARLNIHLHTYANIRSPDEKFETDDPWPEDL